MKVKLLAHTPNPDLLAGLAARVCWSKEAASEIVLDEEKLTGTLKKAIERGHTSVMEHVTFTFSIEGISRACSHQLVRHRMASYSQQSQRYVSLDEPEYVTPPKINGDPAAKELYDKRMTEAWRGYRDLLEAGVREEDARFVLPNSAKTNIVVTMNARSLLSFFKLRCCLHAQWEIRGLASEMLLAVREVAPKLFDAAGAPCVTSGNCPESDTSCELYAKHVGKSE